MVNTVILAPDQLFAGRGLLYREYRRQRLYLNNNGGHRPFKALRIRRGDKSHSLRRVVYRRSGESRIVTAHDGDIVFSGDILRRDQHRARLREGGKRFYLPHHAARHLGTDYAAQPAAGNLYVLKKLNLSRNFDGTVKARQRLSDNPELFAHRRPSQLDFSPLILLS